MPDKVKDWMSSPVVIVDADSSVSFALAHAPPQYPQPGG